LILVDAGPLVALIDSGDAYHQDCVVAVTAIREPMLTAW